MSSFCILGKPHSALEAAVDDVRSLPLLTYRRDIYPPLREGTNITSDAGWGCFLRSGQMMLATYLHRHVMPDLPLSDVLDQFIDNPAGAFSLHRFIEVGVPADDADVTAWWSPTLFATSAQKLMTAAATPMCVGVSGTLYDEDVRQALVTAAGAVSCSSSVLIAVPVRAGIGDASSGGKIDPRYHDAALHLLRSPNSLGIVGGVPSRSYYFVGVDDDARRVYYLDPHVLTQPAYVSPETRGVWHLGNAETVDVSALDPSFLALFAVDSVEAWEGLRRHLQSGPTSTLPLVSVSARRPTEEEIADLCEACEWSEDGEVVLEDHHHHKIGITSSYVHVALPATASAVGCLEEGYLNNSNNNNVNIHSTHEFVFVNTTSATHDHPK
eukprot:PhM_4_TR7241/c0_g1_i1/m.42851/K08342/ATG4; cysteine protease ATG4